MKFKKITLFLILTLGADTLLSAPYCAVFSFGKQCYYYNYKSCIEAAGNQGACVINQEEVKAPSGNAPWASYGTQCYYYSAQACRDAADSANVVCAINPNHR